MGLFTKGKIKANDHVPAVCDVDILKYKGLWYEIARLPHSFEDGLSNVTATYNLKDNGKIEVVNQGFKNGKKSTVKGEAWVADPKCTGKLYVKFFWLFKSEYRIIYLDQKDYQYAVVTSSTKDYLWILSKEPRISDELFKTLIDFASDKGYDISRLIKVVQ